MSEEKVSGGKSFTFLQFLVSQKAFFLKRLETATALIEELKSISTLSQISKDETILTNLIQFLPSIKSDQIFDKMLQIIVQIGRHSMNVEQIKEYLKQCSNNSLQRSQKMPSLIKALLEIWNKNGPRFYFSFDGDSSGLRIPCIENWPSSAYTLCMNFRVESFEPLQPSTCPFQPRLICFLSKLKGTGLEILFSSPGKLAVRTTNQKVAVEFEYEFEAKKWYFIALVHKKNTLSKDELSLFVDGMDLPVCTKKLEYPSISPENCDFYIGTNFLLETSFSVTKTKAPFRGQMGAISIFRDALGEKQIKSFYQLAQTHEMISIDALQKKDWIFSSTAQTLFFYNPRISDVDLCYNYTDYNLELKSSPNVQKTEKFINKESKLNAIKLPGTSVIVTHDLKTSLYCGGGFRLILPLFYLLDQPVKIGDEKFDYTIDTSLLPSILELITKFISSSNDSFEQMLSLQGPSLISLFLQKISPKHFTVEAIDCLSDLVTYLVGQGESVR